MSSWIAMSIVAILLLIGFIREFAKVRRLRRSHEFASKYLNNFLEWYKGRAQDSRLYADMMHDANRMQELLGNDGTVSIRMPFESAYHSNVPVILQGVSAIKRDYYDIRGSVSETAKGFAQLVEDTVRRVIGRMSDDISNAVNRQFNPLVLFCSGVSGILELPLVILTESGLISSAQSHSIVAGRLFAGLRLVVSLLSFLGTVITIVLGWQSFVGLIKQIV